ncbi:transcription factor Ken-like isoform X2 [Octopus sinensis]|uniref:Transcription factor Ken-like isoform X2 n=1 Tax=Octopus sinensis TaxID=2607531 RepID=A0A7E6EPM8_9MOLL|nr:transcription factor Ken-like isoform X2 [Octopus sinensis]
MRTKRSSLGRLTKSAQRARERRKRESTEERQLRLRNHRQRELARRRAETPEQRQARLEAQKQRTNTYRTSLKIKMTQEKKNKTQHLGKQHLQNQKLRNQQSHDIWQMDSALSSPKTSKCVHLTTKMPVQQDSSLSQASQNITKPAQVLTSPFQITPSKSKLVKDPNQTTVSKSIIRKKDLLKRKLLVTSHQHCVISNLASMWRSRKLCDASISNGSSTVMVHKIVLSAVSPKLFSIFSTHISSEVFEVKFPEVSTETLMAFVEYIYTGLLDLDLNILQQLKVIAKRLDMKDLQNLCDAHLQSGARQQLASTVTAFDDTRQMPSFVSNTISKTDAMIQTSSSFPTPISTKFVSAVHTEDIKQEISQNELAELKEDTLRTFKQESQASSLDTNGGNPPVGSLILPTVKIEPVGPDDDEYGQMNKRAYTSGSVSDNSQALNTPLNSIAVSTTDFSLPFSDTTNSKATANKIYGTSPKLKSNVFESSPVSDLSPVSYSEEKLCSESRLIREDSSKPLTRTVATQSIDNSVNYGSNDDVYPVGLFTAEGDRLPLSSTQVTNVKNTGLYKTDGFT